MESAVTIIQEVGFPIAAALGLGFFIYKLIIIYKNPLYIYF